MSERLDDDQKRQVAEREEEHNQDPDDTRVRR